jgi:CRISPR system Cascade subunit CasB
MNGFIEWLAKINEKDSRARAVLRRSLAFDPGEYPAAFPYVEPFLKGEENVWRRQAYYLVAGLWAQHWRQGAEGAPQTLAKACFEYCLKQEKSPSVERRFITLLDSDGDQLPYRLRQTTALLKDYQLDFEGLLKDLLFWNNEKKRVRDQWARDFYRNWQPDEDEDEAVDETNMAKEAE